MPIAAAAICVMPAGPAKAKLDIKSLQAISAEARHLCQRANLSGSATKTQDTAGGGFNISAIISRIGRLGGNVEVKRDRQQDVYNGVLAKDLAASIASYNNCVERTVRVLLEHLDTRDETAVTRTEVVRRAPPKAPARTARTAARTEYRQAARKVATRSALVDRVDVTNLPNYFVYVDNNCSQGVWVSFYYLDSSGLWTFTRFYQFPAKFKNYVALENGAYLIARSNYMGWFAAPFDNSASWTGSSKDSYTADISGTRYTFRGDYFQGGTNRTLTLTTCPS